MKEIIYNQDNLKDPDIEKRVVRARGLIINSQKEILMCYSHVLAHYEFPGGHLEENEDLIGGLKREIYEETGIKIANREIKPFMVIKYYTNNYYDSNQKHLIEIYYFIINTDKKYNIQKIRLTEREIKEEYKCLYLKTKELKDILVANKKANKQNNTMIDDMLLVWNEYLKNDI